VVEIWKINKDLDVFYQPGNSPIEDTVNVLLAHSDAAISHDISQEFDWVDMEHRFLLGSREVMVF